MVEENEDLQLNQEQEEEEEEEEIEGGRTEEQAGPKISLIELLIWPLPAAIISDLVDFFDWSGIGTIIAWALNILSSGSLTLWLFMKGLRGEFMLLAGAIDMIPIIGMFPTKTTILIYLYVQQKHPKALGMAAKGLEVAGKATGQAELAVAGKALEATNQETAEANNQSE